MAKSNAILLAFEEWYIHSELTEEQKELERDTWVYKTCLKSFEAGSKWATKKVVPPNE